MRLGGEQVTKKETEKHQNYSKLEVDEVTILSNSQKNPDHRDSIRLSESESESSVDKEEIKFSKQKSIMRN